MADKRITLFANGCSHTAGSEIDFVCQDHKYEGAWPKWLAEDLGWDWVNIARPGACNEAIRRTTIEWVIKNVELNNTYSPANLVVVLMWSGFNRSEIWSDHEQQLISVSGHADLSRELPELREYIKYKTMVDIEPVLQYRNLFDVYLTAKYLEGLGIKYYFFNAFDIWPAPEKITHPNLAKSYKVIYDAYGIDRITRHSAFNNSSERFWEYMRTNKIPKAPHARWSHYDETGHKFWKEYVKSWITKVDALTQ